MTFVIRNSGVSSLPGLQSLHYTPADGASKGDAISSVPVERERYSKAPIYPDLTGKVTVVTGGLGGIGAATCRLLARNGVKVAVNGRDEAKIGDVVDAIRSTDGEALGVVADCTDLATVERMCEQTVEEGRGALATLFRASESSSWNTDVTLDVVGGKVRD